jgi:phospholipid/cholesterol/gamma-HCH transport system substrate-binding protein
MGDVAVTIESVTQLSARLASLVEATDKHGDLTGTMKNMRLSSEELRAAIHETRGTLKTTLDNMAAVSKTTKALTTDRQAQLGKAIDDFSSASEKLDRLAGRLDSLRAVLHEVANKVNHGDATLGKLVNDKQLYENTSATMDSLRALITDIKKNPKKYVKIGIF